MKLRVQQLFETLTRARPTRMMKFGLKMLQLLNKHWLSVTRIEPDSSHTECRARQFDDNLALRC